MPDDDRIWKNKFEEANLENENWLDPSDKVLIGIKSRVHNKYSRKRYLWLLLILLPVLFIAKEYSESPENIIDSKASLLSEGRPEIDKTELGLQNDKEVAEESKVSKIPSIINTNIAENKLIIKSDNTPVINDSTKNVLGNFIETSKIATSKKSTQSNQLTSNSGDAIKNNSDESFVSFETPKSPLEGLMYLKSPVYLVAFQPDFYPGLPLLNLTNFDQKSKNNSLSLGLGYHFWNFRLNNNYETALNPADFSHTIGQGYAINVQYTRKINKKVHFNLTLGHAIIYAKSGHNSTVEYHLYEEMNSIPENEIDLTMASPLGFMQSNIIIERQSQITNQNHPLTLAVHNEHIIRTTSLSPTLGLLLYADPKLELTGYIGAGINWISGIQNKLAAFEINDQKFVSKSGDITSSQQSINNFTYFSTAGITVKRNLISGYFIGTSVNAHQNFQPIYAESDFSTTISGAGIQFFIGRNF